MQSPSADYEPETFGELVKRCRLRISYESRSLGKCLRLPSRVGKAVTQEEAAEAIGISRVWLAMIERNRPPRVSARVLERIAEALMMNTSERADLFRLALPEVRSTALSERSLGMLDAFASMRRFIQRLWSATTDVSVLRAAREQVITEIGSDASLTFSRDNNGDWIVESNTGDEGSDRVKEALTLIRQACGEAGVDDLHCYTIMSQPGELISQSERDALFPAVAKRANHVLTDLRLSGSSFTMAHVMTQNGVVRLSALYNTAHECSGLERAQLSTIAELTSFALSGPVSRSSGTTET